MIVTSHAYRMAGADDTIKTASGNRHYQVRSPIRMESQVVRDSLLRLAGQLQEQLGGPPVDPQKQELSQRRSLYFRQSRDHQHKFVGMFDDADILRCYRRQESIIPQQALALSNSRIAFQAAGQIAVNVSQLGSDDVDFIRQAGLLILARQPDDSEVQFCLESLAELKRLAGDRNGSNKNAIEMRARTGIVLALINSNDFVTIR